MSIDDDNKAMTEGELNPYAAPSSRSYSRPPSTIPWRGVCLMVAGLIVLAVTAYITIFGGWFYGPIMAAGVYLLLKGWFLFDDGR